MNRQLHKNKKALGLLTELYLDDRFKVVMDKDRCGEDIAIMGRDDWNFLLSHVVDAIDALGVPRPADGEKVKAILKQSKPFSLEEDDLVEAWVYHPSQQPIMGDYYLVGSGELFRCDEELKLCPVKITQKIDRQPTQPSN